ncbi:hypothetical protein D3C71_1400980 [compost metagenome]
MVSNNNPTTLGAIQAQYMENNKDKKTLLTNIVDYTNKIMNSYRTTVDASKLVDELGAAGYKVGDWAVKFKKDNGRDPSPTEYYNNAVSILKNNMKTPVASDILVAQAYRLTIKYFTADKISYDDLFKLSYDLSLNGTQYRGFNKSDKLTDFVQEQVQPPSLTWGQQINTLESLLEDQAATRGSLNGLIDDSIKNSSSDNDPQSLLLKIQTERATALRNHLNQIANWEQRERTIQNQLRTTALTTLGDMFDDEWAPRRLIMYYENRAYIGHFDSFSYTRVADSPLIQYDMRFTVEKQILGTMY